MKKKTINSKKAKLLVTTSVVAVATVAPAVTPVFQTIAHAAGEFAGGTGTQADPYLISTADQLHQIRNFNTSFFKLVSDIDLVDYNWAPIPSFTGELDGNNHTIENLYIGQGNGFINSLNGGKVKNLTFNNPLVKSASGFAGTLASTVQQNAFISYVEVKNGEIESASTSGGIVGSLTDSTIEKSNYEGKITTSSSHTGGLVGYGKGAINISKSFSSVEIISASTSGGIVGLLDGNGKEPLISDVFSKGSIKSVAGISGGIIGQILNLATLTNAYSTMEIESMGDTGGIIGNGPKTTKLRNVYALNTTVFSTNYKPKNGYIIGNPTETNLQNDYDVVKGYVAESLNFIAHPNGVTDLLQTSSLTKQSSYPTFDFSDIWVMSENGLPVLQHSPTVSSVPEMANEPRLEVKNDAFSIPIRTAEDLQSIVYAQGAKFHLTNNIDLSGIEWMPIMDFKGQIDGQGYSIQNLFVQTHSDTGTGFIGSIQDLKYISSIQNLTFENPRIVNLYAQGNTGVVIGILKNLPHVIKNVHVKNGSVNGYKNTGGLFGYVQMNSQDSNIQNVSFQGSVSGSTSTGGIVGGAGSINLKSAFVAAEVQGTGEVGGIIGKAAFQGTGSSVTVSDVFTTGKVFTSGNYAGGLLGSANGITLKNAYSTSEVKGSQYIAGISGTSVSTMKNVYAYNSLIEGTQFVGYFTGDNSPISFENNQAIKKEGSNLNEGGLYKYISVDSSLKKDTYLTAGFDFDSPVWVMNEGTGSLPYLANMPYVETNMPGYEPIANTPPTVGTLPNQTIKLADDTKQVDVASFFNDLDGDELVYEVSTNNANITASNNGSLITIEPQTEGESIVSVTATDTKGASVTGTFKVTVEDDEENAEEEAPIVTKPLPDIDFADEEEKEIDLGEHFNDENETFTYSVISSDPDVATATITERGILKISKKNPGTTIVTITVENQKGDKTETSFTVTVPEVENVNQPPVADDIPDQSTNKGTVKTVNLDNYFSDPDSDSLTYSVSASNDVATTAVNGKLLTLTPKSLGSSTITITADDGRGGTVVKTFTFTVENAVPVISLTNGTAKQVITNDSRVQIKGTVSDMDGDALTISATIGGVTKTASVNGYGHFTLEWSGDTISSGKYTNIPVTVTDIQGSSSSTIYTGSIEKEATKTPVLRISDLTSNSVKLSWNQVSANATYAIYRDDVEIYRGTEPSFVDAGLNANTEYIYSIKATVAGEDTPNSSAGIVTMANAPLQINISNVQYEGFETEWDINNNPKGTSYRLIVKDGKTVKVDTVIGTSPAGIMRMMGLRNTNEESTLNYAVSNLEPGKTYSVETRAINKIGIETDSVTKTVTLEDFIVQDMSDLRISESNNEKVVVEWEHDQEGVEFIVEKYRGYVKVSSETITGNKFIDTNVEVGKSYTYKVTPKSVKYDRKAETKSVSTDIPLPEVLGAIQNVAVEKIGDKEHKITWDSLNGAVKYYVEVYEGTTRKMFLSTTDSFLSTDKLEAGKTYKVSVYAMDAYGRSTDKTNIEYEVEKPEPKNITNVTYTINGKNLTLNWDDISTDVFSYYVQTWQGGKQTSNKYVSPSTPTYTASFNKDGEYELRILAYSKETKGFLEPVIVNVSVNKGIIEVTIEDKE